MSESTTFVAACLNGTASLADVDDWVERWHGGAGPNSSLGEFLGLTPEEDGRWATNPESLAAVLDSRRAAAQDSSHV